MLIRLCSSVSMYQCFVSLPHLVLGHLHSEYTLVIICLANLVVVLVSLCSVSGDHSVCLRSIGGCQKRLREDTGSDDRDFIKRMKGDFDHRLTCFRETQPAQAVI